MNKTKLYITTLTSAALLTVSALPASAALRSDLNMEAETTKAAVNIKLDTAGRTKALAQIDARIKALSALETRINEMQRVSASQKASLNATLQTAVDEMTSLKAKITADTDAAALKADIQSITKSYRIYLLVLPQGRITAAADRIMGTSTLLTELAGKLQVRITEAQTAGKDTTAFTANLTDMNAKIADANVQANAAITLIANLKPDNGDKTVFEANQKALKDARAKIKLGTADLQAARKDAGSIVKGLASFKLTSPSNTQAQVIVDQAVIDEITKHGYAMVIVELKGNEFTKADFKESTKKMSEVHSLQARAQLGLTKSDFYDVKTLDYVPYLGGKLTKSGLDKLKAKTDIIVHVQLDEPGSLAK